MSSRCYGCCQENCGYTNCTCGCHTRDVELTQDAQTMVASMLKGYLRSPCKKHHSYKAIRKPRTPCEECWRFYIKTNP